MHGFAEGAAGVGLHFVAGTADPKVNALADILIGLAVHRIVF